MSSTAKNALRLVTQCVFCHIGGRQIGGGERKNVLARRWDVLNKIVPNCGRKGREALGKEITVAQLIFAKSERRREKTAGMTRAT